MIISKNIQKPLEEKILVPKLMQHTLERIIVLFENPERGTVVGYIDGVTNMNIKKFPIGHTSSAWNICSFNQLPPGYTVQLTQGHE